MFKKHCQILFIVLSTFGFLLISKASALDPINLPPLTSFVSDFSNVLTKQQLSELNTIAKNYQDKTSNQIVTVLFPNRNGNELIDIGVDIFSKNGIGQNDKDNGLLLMISTQEKKIRIGVGYGLEGIIPDITASNIIENYIRPYVNSGNFYQAINNFYSKSIEIIDAGGDSNYSNNKNPNTQKKSDYFIFIIIGFFIGSLISGLLKKSKKLNPKIKKIKFIFSLIGFAIIIILSAGGLMLILSKVILFFIAIIVGFFLGFGNGFGIGFRGGGFGGGGGGD